MVGRDPVHGYARQTMQERKEDPPNRRVHLRYNIIKGLFDS
jgi:hypothetical protein